MIIGWDARKPGAFRSLQASQLSSLQIVVTYITGDFRPSSKYGK